MQGSQLRCMWRLQIHGFTRFAGRIHEEILLFNACGTARLLCNIIWEKNWPAREKLTSSGSPKLKTDLQFATTVAQKTKNYHVGRSRTLQLSLLHIEIGLAEQFVNAHHMKVRHFLWCFQTSLKQSIRMA